MKMRKLLTVLLVLALVFANSVPISAASKKLVTVTFKYDDSTFVKKVRYGTTIDYPGTMFVAPKDKEFVKWDKSLKNIKKNTTITAIFRDCVPHVVFSKTVATGDTFNFGTNIDAYSLFKTSWKSSDKKIATVSSKGVVKALADGEVTLTFKAYKEGVGTTFFECNLVVSDNAQATEYNKVENKWNCGDWIPVIIASDTLVIGESVNLSKELDLKAGDYVEYKTSGTEYDEDSNEILNIDCSASGIVTATTSGITELNINVYDESEGALREVIITYTVVEAE